MPAWSFRRSTWKCHYKSVLKRIWSLPKGLLMLKGFSNTVCHFGRPTQAAITSFWYECGTSVTQTSCIYCLVKNFSSSLPNLGIFLWSIKSWGLINFLPILPCLKGYLLYRGMNEILKASPGPLGGYYPPRACSGANRSARWLEPAACPASVFLSLLKNL